MDRRVPAQVGIANTEKDQILAVNVNKRARVGRPSAGVFDRSRTSAVVPTSSRNGTRRKFSGVDQPLNFSRKQKLQRLAPPKQVGAVELVPIQRAARLCSPLYKDNGGLLQKPHFAPLFGSFDLRTCFDAAFRRSYNRRHGI